MLNFRTFGGAVVEGDDGPLGGAAAQRRLLAILSVLAVSGERGVSRDRLLALLWPEGEPERARHALTQSLYHLKRALDAEDVIISAGDLRLNPAVIQSDVTDFDAAIEAGQLERAVELYRGPFLDGFYITGSAEYEQWVSAQRDRLSERCSRALDQLASKAEAAGEYETAVRWRKRLAALDPLNSSVAVRLMTAMAAAGDRAGAIQYAKVHEVMLRDQLEAAPDAAVLALAERLREESTWSVAESGMTIGPVGGAAGRERIQGGEGGWDDSGSSALASPTGGGPPAEEGRSREGSTRRPDPGRARPRPSGWPLVAGAALLITLLVAVGMLARRSAPDPSEVAIDTNLIAVAPFRTTGADPSLAFLREGMVDLLLTKLTDEGSARAADPGTVMRAWRRAGLSDETDVPVDHALTAARQLGAGQLLLGGIVGTPSRVVINASLLSVPDGSPHAQASVEGPSDSLTVLVDRLAAQLLARQAGEWERLASHTSTSLPALRSYLRGQSALREGRYSEAIQHLTRAVQRDTTFAMAGLGLALAADRVGAVEERARGIAVAWASRADLTERDRAYLEAFAGPRYPAPSPDAERLAAWERAAAAAPDRADVWNELGERLLQDGMLLGIAGHEERARAAFRRATALDPSLAQPQQYLVQLAAQEGNARAVHDAWREYARVDSSSDMADFVRWRVAVALGDSAALARVRQRLDGMSDAGLRAVAMSAMYDGVPGADGQRALALLRARAARANERLDALVGEHALLLNQGRVASAFEATEEMKDVAPGPQLHLRLRVTDALYSVGDAAAADSAERILLDPRAPVGSPGGRAVLPAGICVAEQWRISQHRLATAARSIARLREQGPEISGEPRACALLLGAMLAVAQRRGDAIDVVEQVDSLLRTGPVSAEMRAYASLAVSRLYRAVGQTDAALAAVRRRPYLRGWPTYLARHLREEGMLAAEAGDLNGAIRAYRHYLMLRVSPDTRVEPQVDSVRAELAQLEQRPR
jgi:DNA-binding SARP family transcriptional activator